MPATGDFTLELRDLAGRVVQEVSFQPTELHLLPPIGNGSVEDPGVGIFLIPVPASTVVKRAVILHQGKVLASQSATPNPPRVQVLFPNGGENIKTESVTVEWKGSDLDGDQLTYNVEYRSDGGATWQTLVVDWPNTTLAIERKFLAGTNNGLIRVQVSDGFNTAIDESNGVFSVLNNAPEVSIIRPTPNDLFTGVQLISFDALAQDREDGRMPDSALRWTSNIDGFLGTGNNLTKQATDLSEGNHAITLTATDSEGFTNTASVNIAVFRVAAQIVNSFVKFESIESTFRTTSDTTGCPSDFVGKFDFTSRLINTSESTLSALAVAVETLTNGNLLQNANGGPSGVGAQLSVPKVMRFSDGFLSPKESVDVPFVVCLKENSPFSFSVNVAGVVLEED